MSPKIRLHLRLIGIISTFAITAPVPASAQPVQHEPVAFAFGGIEFLGDTSDKLTVGVGAFDIRSGDGTSAEFRFEYQYGKKWHALAPLVGIAGNADGGVFAYAGVHSELLLKDRWIITPAVGAGAYERGDGKILGGTFEFHLGLDVAYWFENGGRLGLKFTHISNSDLQGTNPGVESILLTYTTRLGDLGR